MAFYDTTRLTTFGRESRTKTSLLATFLAWREGRATRKALSKLTDRELTDIGLKRADIDLMSDWDLAGR